MVKPPGAVARRRRTAVCTVSLFNPRVTVSVWPPEFVALIVMIAESEPEKVPAPFVLATNKPRVAVFVVFFPTPGGGINVVGGPAFVDKIKKMLPGVGLVVVGEVFRMRMAGGGEIFLT